MPSRKAETHGRAPQEAANEAAALPRSPERDEADADEEQAGGNHQQPRVVVSRRAVLTRVVAGLAEAHHRHEEPDPDRQRRASAGSQARVGPGCEDKECGLHEAAGR